MTMTHAPSATARSAISELSFRAMGGAAHVTVLGGPASLVDDARRRIDVLENAWSRFLPDSELNRLNSSSGWSVRVSEDLFGAVVRAIDAWRLTEGTFDPTVLRAVEAAGYDRSFEHVVDLRVDGRPMPAPGCARIDIDSQDNTIAIPRGTAIDLGGIGKGLAADIVVAELLAAGADGALVNIGGDLKAAGAAPGPDGWIIEIEDPFAPHGLRVAIEDGAVCTSSRLEKRWIRGGRPMHHIIDPSNGAPVSTELVTVSVVAREAWWAEALATCVFVRGADVGREILASHGVQGVFFTAEGSRTVAGDWSEILA